MSSNATTNTWLITGAGRGMGVDCAQAALAAGHNVVASWSPAAELTVAAVRPVPVAVDRSRPRPRRGRGLMQIVNPRRP